MRLLAQNFPDSDKTLIVVNFFDLFAHCLSTFKEEIDKDLKQKDEATELEPAALTRKASTANLDWNETFKTVIQNWKKHESTEEKDISKDNLLWSIVKLVKKMLVLFKDTHSYQEFIDFTEETQLLSEIFLENLFYIPGLTKNAKQNKCKGKESRTVCY